MSRFTTNIMRCTLTSILALILLAGGVVMAAEQIVLPPINTKVLDNGLKIVTIENHEQPVISISLMVKSGSAMDPADKAGLASLTADLLRRGTTTRSANDVSAAIDYVGGTLGAGSDLDASYVRSSVLTKHFDVGLDLLSDVVLNPTFPEEEVERQRKQLIAGLMAQKDDPNAIVNEQYALHLFGKHPYGKPQGGTIESVSEITVDDLKNFWQVNYVPNNSVLFVAGDVKPKEIFDKVSKKFGGWKKGEIPGHDFPSPPMRDGMSIVLINKPDATQSSIKIGHLGVDRYNPDLFSIRVMNYILGGGGFVSRLMSEVREDRGLTYDIRSQFTYNRYPGEFTVTTFTNTDSTAKAIIAAIEQIKKLRSEGVTQEELSETISFYEGYFPRIFETPRQVTDQMETVELYGLDQNYLTDYLKNVAAVTTDAARKAAEDYIHPERFLIVVVGQADAIRESLNQIAPVVEYELVDL